MSIIVSTAKTAGFIPVEVVCQEALRLLRANLRLGSYVRRPIDFGEPVSKGDTITVPYPGQFRAVNKPAGTPTSSQRPYGGTKTQLTVDKHRVVDTIVEDAANTLSNPNLLEIYLNPMMTALAEMVELDIAAGLMGLSNSRGTAGTDMTNTLLLQAMSDLSTRKIPMTERLGYLHPKDYGSLLGSSNLGFYLATNLAEAIRDGNLPRLYDFAMHQGQLAPQTAVQRITFTGSTTGNFRLLWCGFPTGDIAFSSTAATLASNIQTALRALVDPITVGTQVSCSGSGTGPWQVDITWSGTCLNYPSAVLVTTEQVSGTPLDGSTAVTTTGTVTTTCFGLHPEAALFAPCRFAPEPANAGAEIVDVMDEESGLTFRMLMQYDMSNRGVRLGFDMLYGVKLLRDAAGVRLLT